MRFDLTRGTLSPAPTIQAGNLVFIMSYSHNIEIITLLIFNHPEKIISKSQLPLLTS